MKQKVLIPLTSTSSELCASLRLALVSARGPLQRSTSCRIGGYFGILMPTKSQPGFRSAFRRGCRVNIVVTAPGNISSKTLVGTVTLAYLKWYGAHTGILKQDSIQKVKEQVSYVFLLSSQHIPNRGDGYWGTQGKSPYKLYGFEDFAHQGDRSRKEGGEGNKNQSGHKGIAMKQTSQLSACPGPVPWHGIT